MDNYILTKLSGICKIINPTIFIRKLIVSDFSAFYGQHLVAAAWTNPIKYIICPGLEDWDFMNLSVVIFLSLYAMCINV